MSENKDYIEDVVKSYQLGDYELVRCLEQISAELGALRWAVSNLIASIRARSENEKS